MKSQIRMFETVAVLVVFFFLLMAGSMFYFSAQKSSIVKEAVRAADQSALQVVLKSLYLPELDCSFMKTPRENCVDMLKVDELSKLLKNDTVRQDYFSEFGFAVINISMIYPRGDYIVVYNNTPSEYKDARVTQSPILMYDPFSDEYRFGIIEVKVYV